MRETDTSAVPHIQNPHIQKPSTSSNATDSKGSGDSFMYSEEWHARRSLKSANMVDMLADRQIGGRSRVPLYRYQREFFTTLPLARGIVCPEMLSRDHIVSWSPDGSRLICYSAHLDAVRVYHYRGSAASRNMQEERVLSSLFKFDFEVKPNVSDGYQLRLDAVYFTADARFLVVGATASVPDANIQLDNVFANNEGLVLHSNFEDLCLMCIDFEKKEIASEKIFDMDRIPLAHAVNVSGHYLLVTSIQHQIMYIIQIHPTTGKMHTLKELGPAIRDDDTLRTLGDERTHLMTKFFTGFKQNIMTFLYKKAKWKGQVFEFLRTAEYFHSLRIDRAFLFEEFYLLIRMLPKDANRDSSANPCFFVLMDWRTAKILDIFDEYNERFLHWAMESCEVLTFPKTEGNWVGASNFCYHAQWTMIKGIRRGEARHCIDSMRRLLNQLPLPSYQPYKILSMSPYMDSQLFQLDPKMSQGIINGKLKADLDDPRFIVLRTGKSAFQLSLHSIAGIGLRQVTLLFHPQDCTALAVDRQRQDSSIVVFQPSLERERDASDSYYRLNSGRAGSPTIQSERTSNNIFDRGLE